MQKPNLFIVGVPKSGTTSMHSYLAQHPEIFMSPHKEPYYFAPDLYLSWRIGDISKYLSLFKSAENAKYIGESSPCYMYSKFAAKNIKQFCPQAKIIVMLRHPVDMLYSLHGQLLLTAHEDIFDFEEALAAQEERKQGKRIPEFCEEPKLLFYFDIAKYPEQIKRYLDLFGRENIHVIWFDELNQDIADSYRKMLTFLGVDPTFEAKFDIHNPAKSIPNLAVRSFLLKRPTLKASIRKLLPAQWVNWARDSFGRLTQCQRPKKIDAALRSKLTQLFEPEIKELGCLLGRDLTHWLR